jgi:hypothetical protein
MKNNYYVYAHINPTNDEVFYVGKGRGRRAYDVSRRTNWWKNYYKKYGRLVMFIKINLTEKESLDIEKKWISNYGRKDLGKGRLLNLCDGGIGPLGQKPNKTSFKKGLTPWNKGKKASEESKLKMSISTKGRQVWNKGKKHSEETKLKISIAKNGKPSNNLGKKHSEQF